MNTNAEPQFSVARNIRGDDEVHRAGCAHLKQRRLIQRVLYTETGPDLISAIVSADEGMAAEFGETAYSDPATQGSQPWSVQVLVHAPCFAEMLARDGITFSGQWGRPERNAR